MNKEALQKRGQDAAVAYLERIGICVVDREWACAVGRIDILAWDAATLVIVDVKTRQAGRQGHSGVVSAAVARRVKKLAEAYVEYADLEAVTWRYDRIDLLVISGDRALLRHYRDALNTLI